MQLIQEETEMSEDVLDKLSEADMIDHLCQSFTQEPSTLAIFSSQSQRNFIHGYF